MGACVVVIEDEAPLLQLLGDILDMGGYQPLCLDHARDAETIVADAHPALFLIDLLLPEMSGIDLAAELRESGFRETPMIAISASVIMLAAARASGLFQDTVAKPFDIDRILDAVHHYATPAGKSISS
jgi:CheY-like chemotaxis protein